MQLRNRTCNHCKNKYQPTRKDQKFCSTECSTSHHNLAKAKARQAIASRRKLKLPYTAFWQGIAREVRRAGTAEILKGHTAASLYDLYKLRKSTTLASGLEQGEVNKQRYELSHIVPSSGHSEYVGLLHSHNLIVAPFAFNRSRGSSYHSGGLYIKRKDLKDKWRIRDKDSVKEIFSKMHAYLGTELDSFLADNVLTITQREQLIRKIIKRTIAQSDNGLTEREESSLRYTLDNLDALELKEKAESLEIKINTRSLTSKSELTVLHEELIRCSTFRSDLAPLFMLVDAFYAKKNSYGDEFDIGQSPIFEVIGGVDTNELKQSINKACWKALHGDRYTLTHQGIPFLSCFALGATTDPDWQPVLELEKALFKRDGQPEAYADYYERTEAEAKAKRIANTPIWEIKDDSIFPEGMDIFDRVYSCSIEHLRPADPWLEWRDLPF